MKLGFASGSEFELKKRLALIVALIVLSGCATSPSEKTAGTNTASLDSIIKSDARWAHYRDYLDEIVRKTEAQWHQILKESRKSPPRGSTVTITFRINANGEIDILQVDDAGCGKQGVWAATNAIQYNQPYGKWNDLMTAVLGNEQTLVFRFYYR